MQTNPQERTTGPSAKVPGQSHTGNRETVKPRREEVTTQNEPKASEPLVKRGAEGEGTTKETNDPREKEAPQELPGDHRQNPADPTRKDGDVAPIYADERYASGEDMEEPTPLT